MTFFLHYNYKCNLKVNLNKYLDYFIIHYAKCIFIMIILYVLFHLRRCKCIANSTRIVAVFILWFSLHLTHIDTSALQIQMHLISPSIRNIMSNIKYHPFCLSHMVGEYNSPIFPSFRSQGFIVARLAMLIKINYCP